MPLPVAILCGGLGTRLGAETAYLPKSLVDVGGKPFLVRQLELLKRNGYTDIVLLIGHLGSQIQDRIGDGSAFGVHVRYSWDAEPLWDIQSDTTSSARIGTNAAIQKALPLLGKRFFTLYGDSYLDCDYGKIERTFIGRDDTAMVTTWGTEEYGLNAYKPSHFTMLDERDRYQGYSMARRYLEIGSPEGLAEVRALFTAPSAIQTDAEWTSRYLRETAMITNELCQRTINDMAAQLHAVRLRGGRVFFLGVGGSAANASHAVNDFRKLCEFEAYSPTDNVAELTARTNDEGWPSAYAAWLQGSRLSDRDAVFVLSVGGGSQSANVSYNLVRAIIYAAGVGAKVFGIVGRDGGCTKELADCCILVPTVNPDHVTPHTEEFQSVILHLLVSHPLLKRNKTTW